MTDRLDRLETLAAFAAGELDDAQRREAEALIRSDPSAAADLERLIALDEVLATTEAPDPPAGAHERLLAALDPVMAAELGPESGDEPSRVRALFGWLVDGRLAPRLAAGAAALVVIAGVGIGLSQIGGLGDAGAGFETVSDDEAGTDAAADAPLSAGEGGAALLAGGDYDEAEALALLDSYATGARPAPEAASVPRQSDGTATGTTADDTVQEGAVDFAYEAIDRCAPKPLESGPGEQRHGELATYNDEPAIVFVIERPDSSLELWVLERSDCGILLFHRTDARDQPQG